MSNDDMDIADPTDAEIAADAAYWRAVYTAPAYLATLPSDEEIDRALDGME